MKTIFLFFRQARFCAQRGAVNPRSPEGVPEAKRGAVLVVSVIVLWNTIYMQAALEQLRAEGYPVRDEDVVRLCRSATATSTCSGRTRSPCQNRSPGASSGR